MNYLAHIYLSGNKPETIIGNFVGDFIKGHNFGYYSTGIQKGILLHRNIDLFTDTNDIVKSSKSFFQKKYHKYSGIIVDVVYDHYLIINWSKYSNQDLIEFKSNLHILLQKHADLMPEKVQEFLPSFIEKDWIGAYTSLEGLKIVFNKMSKRTSLPNETNFAIKMIKENYESLDTQFNKFFPEIIDFVKRCWEIDLP